MISASGAIFVLGGYGYNTAYLGDVWASTDQGARACACVSVRSGVLCVGVGARVRLRTREHTSVVFDPNKKKMNQK